MDMASSSTATHNQSHPENAFDQLAPYYPAPKSTEPWDIFINHCGRDVKHTLATSIYNKLHSMGFHVFLDKDALQPGDSFPAKLQHVIATATLHIAIFSSNYAASPWCLAELSFMLKSGAKIIPIFYEVDPSDLRYIDQGKGKYAPAFSEHAKKGRYTPEKLNEWKRALRDTSFLHGYPINKNEDEASVLKNIVNGALKIMKKAPLWVAEHPIGLDELVQDFESVATEEGVKIRGIVGMGGSGKTTLAKQLYNNNFPSFERRSFVFDVRDVSRNTLCEKQKKLLADLGLHDSPFDHVDEGKVILANRLSTHQVLIVLDDVDHIEQLVALLPNKHNLGSNSMVIVTTRELGVLKSWGISCCIYKMPALAKPHAQRLFCWHAFLQPFPPAEFETLVQDFLKACDGLPLSLKVLGGQLYGNDSRAYWKSLLHKILRILPGEINKRLQVSYDALDEEEREMFLDIACFFIGEGKSKAIAVWDGLGWTGLHGLETLVNKCLVELVDVEMSWEDGAVEEVYRRDSIIRMHDHLRDMGREIASRQSPYRLWSPQQIDNMKKDSMRRKQIRGIHPADAFVAFKEYRDRSIGNSTRRSKRLRSSNELQILSVQGNEFTEEIASLSEDLVWLRWEGFPLENVPSWLTSKNLSVLELRRAYELEGLWSDNTDPPLQLRELILTGCQKLQRLPTSIRHLQHLKRLVAEFYGSSLPEEFCSLKSLERLQLHSPELSSVPASFGNLKSLRSIILPNCRQLRKLPDSFCQLIHLEDLDLSECEMLSSLPADFGNLKSLRKIKMWSCLGLSKLPDSFSQLIHLEDLVLSSCPMLSLPADFGNLKSLRKIKMWMCVELSKLPDSFSQLIHLEDLDLSQCEMLSSLPADFGNLKSLREINMWSCVELSKLPDSFSQLIHLEDLDLSRCQMLSSLPADFGNLKSLRKITMSNCVELSKLPDSFSQLIHLEYLDLSFCKMLSSLPADSFSQLIHLKDLNLSYCSNLLNLGQVEVRRCEQLTLPLSLKVLRIKSCNSLKNIRCISGLINLEDLEIQDCVQIEELPSFEHLASLRTFQMWNCPKVEKIQGLEHAWSLKSLIVYTNWRVPGIQSLENVERLELVELRCESISAVKPCIHSIKGKEPPIWMDIGGRVKADCIVKCMEFVDVAVTEVEKQSNEWVLQFYVKKKEGNDVERKEVTISCQPSRWWYVVGGAKEVVGERGRVEESFYGLLELLE